METKADVNVIKLNILFPLILDALEKSAPAMTSLVPASQYKKRESGYSSRSSSTSSAKVKLDSQRKSLLRNSIEVENMDSNNANNKSTSKGKISRNERATSEQFVIVDDADIKREESNSPHPIIEVVLEDPQQPGINLNYDRHKFNEILKRRSIQQTMDQFLSTPESVKKKKATRRKSCYYSFSDEKAPDAFVEKTAKGVDKANGIEPKSAFEIRRSRRKSVCAEKFNFDPTPASRNSNRKSKPSADVKEIEALVALGEKTEEVEPNVNQTKVDEEKVPDKDAERVADDKETAEVVTESAVMTKLKPGRKKRQRSQLEPSVHEVKQAAKRRKTEETDYEPVVIDEVIEDIWHVSLATVEKELCARFLVKWDGFPPTENTLEPFEHVAHADVLKEYVKRKFEMHQDRIQVAMKSLLDSSRGHFELYISKPKSFILSKLANFDVLRFECNILAFIYTYEKITGYSEFMRLLRYNNILYKFLQKIQREQSTNGSIVKAIMKKEKKAFQFTVENKIDYDAVPDFKYLQKVDYPTKSKSENGCKCEGVCKKNSNCCPQTKGLDLVYDVDGRICALKHQMIVECSDACSCNMSCPNRAKANKISVCLFKTADRGWALKTLESIPAGKFVIEYTGELITQAEAKKRTRLYNKTGVTFLFDLDYNEDGEATYSIDATNGGNLSRFINHSCNANLQTWPATSCSEDPKMHRLYYFSLRQIRAGEELTVDYGGGVHIVPGSTPPKDAVRCKCGADICKGYIF